MTPDKDMQQLFNSARAEFEDNEYFLQTLSRSLDKVEYIKQMQDSRIRKYRYSMICALVVGICAGALVAAILDSFQFDFLQFLQVPFLEPRTVLKMAIALLIGASAFWITRNIQEIRQTLGR